MNATNGLAGHIMISVKNHAIDHAEKCMAPRQIPDKYRKIEKH